MKYLLLLASLAVYGQATINAPAVTLDATGSLHVLAWMGAQGTGITQTLAAGISAAETSITLVSAQGIGASAVISIGAEHISVTSKAGNVLTVVRGANGTTAASALSGANVIELRYKTLNSMGRQIMVDALRQIVRQRHRAAPIATVESNTDAAALAAVQ